MSVPTFKPVETKTVAPNRRMGARRTIPQVLTTSPGSSSALERARVTPEGRRW